MMKTWFQQWLHLKLCCFGRPVIAVLCCKERYKVIFTEEDNVNFVNPVRRQQSHAYPENLGQLKMGAQSTATTIQSFANKKYPETQDYPPPMWPC